MQRVLCPRHEERTPSVVVYDDHAFCYGGCGVIPLSELGIARDGGAARNLPPADLEGELARIKSLPLASVRGLMLPVDGNSYYITWPNGDYYKRRKFIAGDGPKYLCPRGHKKPLFLPRLQPKAEALAVVEGELNALSLATLNPPFNVCSPGGSGDFGAKLIDGNKQLFLTCKHFYIIVDRDEAGFKAATAMKKALLPLTPYISIFLMPRDANDLLVGGTLQDEVTKWLTKNGSASTDATKPAG